MSDQRQHRFQTLDEFLATLEGVKHVGGGEYMALCPAHDDRDPSLSVTQEGDRILIHCFGGCESKDVVAALGISMGDLFLNSGRKPSLEERIVCTYDYRDRDGVLLFQVVRLQDPKDFCCRRPNGSGGWVWNMTGVARVPYRLPEVLAAPPDAVIFIVEGEKDANRLAALGLVATCSPGGAGKWRRGYTQHFRDRHVAVFPDNDSTGEKHALDVVTSLHGVAASVKLLRLPDLPDRGDTSVWLDNGGDSAKLADLVAACPEWAETSHKVNLPPIEPAVGSEVWSGGSFESRMVNGAELCRKTLPKRSYLPLLGQEGYVVKGWVTLVAGCPKGGKTELITRLCFEWRDERILYLTEEAEDIWQERMTALAPPDRWGHVTVVYALGLEPEELLAGIASSDATVVVIDTVRNLLQLQDENDNSEIARKLTPYIVACKARGQSLLPVHHVRKGGGEYGEGITGGHAFLGIVDAAVEIWRDASLGDNRRKIKRYGRLTPASDLVYELRADGTMKALGDPAQLKAAAVKGRVLENLNGAWVTVAELGNHVGDPRPSRTQLQNALNALWLEGLAERDPEEPRRGATYRYRLGEGPPWERNVATPDAANDRHPLRPVEGPLGPPDEASYAVYVQGCRFVGGTPLPIDAWRQQSAAVDATLRAEEARRKGDGHPNDGGRAPT